MNRLPPLLPWLLCVLLLAWSARGLTPVVPVEGDEQGVLLGVAGMVGRNAELLQARYTYELQPGYYHLLAGLVRLTGAAPEPVFAATTILGALAFATAGACLLQRLLDWPPGWTLAALLWCQEVTSAAFYLNTSTLGGAVALAALLLALQPGPRFAVAAGLALAVAGWLRADSLLVAPACLGLLYWRDRQWKPAVRRTALIATVSVTAFLLLYFLSGASVAQSLTTYEERGFFQTSLRALLESFPQLLSPFFALAALPGLILLCLPARRALGVVFLTGVTASLLAHGSLLATPKYFYHMLPFLLLPALVALDALFRAAARSPVGRWRATLTALVIVLAADGFIGVRTLAPDQRFFLPTPTLVTLASTPWQDRSLALVIGPGELILNSDGFRVRTGHLFAPLCWRREKQRVQTDLASIRAWLAGDRDLTLYWANWLPLQAATRELFAAGFRRTARAAPWEEWRRGTRLVRLGYLGYAGTSYQPPGPAPASLTGPDTYFIGDMANHPLTELADHGQWRRLSSVPEGFITLYQRQ